MRTRSLMQNQHTEDVPLAEFVCLVFTRMLAESYCRQLRSLLLCLCDVFRALINSFVYWLYPQQMWRVGCWESGVSPKCPPSRTSASRNPASMTSISSSNPSAIILAPLLQTTIIATYHQPARHAVPLSQHTPDLHCRTCSWSARSKMAVSGCMTWGTADGSFSGSRYGITWTIKFPEAAWIWEGGKGCRLFIFM